MRAELVFFGKRISMASRRRRRTLVVAIYAFFTTLIAGGWFLDRWRSTGGVTLWLALLACMVFLGGHYSRGLVKPFNSKPPRQPAMPWLLFVQLRLYRPVLAADEDAFRNDERELRERDHAHYRAYQGIGLALAVLWLPTLWLVRKPEWLARLGADPGQIVFGLLIACFVLYVTLPQAILLWTEPDMEAEDLES
jgi:hypothetical protein